MIQFEVLSSMPAIIALLDDFPVYLPFVGAIEMETDPLEIFLNEQVGHQSIDWTQFLSSCPTKRR